MATSTGAGPANSEAETHKRDRVRLRVEIIGAIVAVVAVVVSVAIAVVQSGKQAEAQTTVNNQQQTINNYGVANSSLQSAYDVANSSIDVLESQVSSLSAVSSSLSSELAGPTIPPASSGGISLSPTTSAAPSTFHQGPLSIAQNGEELDLDAPASVRSWSIQQGGKTDLDYALGNEPFLQPRNGAKFSPVLATGTEANYETCSGPLPYNSGDGNALLLSKALPGAYLCVETDENRYSALQVVSADKTQMTFNVTTYDPPFR